MIDLAEPSRAILKSLIKARDMVIPPLPLIEFGKLKTELDNAMQFLQSKVQGEIRRRGSQIQVDQAKPRDLKLLLHKYLHEKGLKDYRVLTHPEGLEIAPKKEPAKTKTESPIRGVPPFPPLSPSRLPLMQVVYPNYPPPYQPTRKKARR